MIKNPDILRKFENDLMRSEPPNYEENLKIFEAMYAEAAALGVLPAKDPLEDIERKIKFAKDINSV